jgi:hypothetical protein
METRRGGFQAHIFAARPSSYLPTFLVVLVRAGPGARPVLRVALGPRRLLLLLGARTLAEVDPLGQARQVLGHGQRLQVGLSAIQAHFLHVLLAGRLDADSQADSMLIRTARTPDMLPAAEAPS